MISLTIRETNRKAKQSIEEWNADNPGRQKKYKTVTLQELETFIAMLLHCGPYQSNNDLAHCLWEIDHPKIYHAVMSHKRFKMPLTYIRFDNVDTCVERSQTSKAAAIVIWPI